MVNLWGRGIAFFSIESITNINAHIYQCSGMVWYFLSKKNAIPAHLLVSCSLINFLMKICHRPTFHTSKGWMVQSPSTQCRADQDLLYGGIVWLLRSKLFH